VQVLQAGGGPYTAYNFLNKFNGNGVITVHVAEASIKLRGRVAQG
jgi:hypothetical protein